MSTATDASPVTAQEWPEQDHTQHPFDDEPRGVLKWMAARAANSRAAAASEWAEVQALAAGPQTADTAERIGRATFHAQRHERDAALYESAWGGAA